MKNKSATDLNKIGTPYFILNSGNYTIDYAIFLADFGRAAVVYSLYEKTKTVVPCSTICQKRTYIQ